jgi:hypothetical protein
VFLELDLERGSQSRRLAVVLSTGREGAVASISSTPSTATSVVTTQLQVKDKGDYR